MDTVQRVQHYLTRWSSQVSLRRTQSRTAVDRSNAWKCDSESGSPGHQSPTRASESDAETGKKAKKEKAEKGPRKPFRSHVGGTAYGFDPKAGMRSSDEVENLGEGFYIKSSRYVVDPGDLLGEHEHDALGRDTGRRWHRGNRWGIERGGPGMSGQFEYGSLRPVSKMTAKREEMHRQESSESYCQG